MNVTQIPQFQILFKWESCTINGKYKFVFFLIETFLFQVHWELHRNKLSHKNKLQVPVCDNSFNIVISVIWLKNYCFSLIHISCFSFINEEQEKEKKKKSRNDKMEKRRKFCQNHPVQYNGITPGKKSMLW